MDRPFSRHASRVTFRDTDASGWAHFTSVFAHVEDAEHACLRDMGLTVLSPDQGGWPRVHVSCDYHRPLRAGDAIEVHLAIAALGTSSVTWRFEILDASGQSTATGTMVTVRVDSGGKPQALSAGEIGALGKGIRETPPSEMS